MEHKAALVQAASEKTRSESRHGINRREEDFKHIVFEIRLTILDGKSPEQTRLTKPRLHLASSTLLPLDQTQVFSMPPCGLKTAGRVRTTQGAGRAQAISHGEKACAAFRTLPEEERAGACETGAVIGRARDGRRRLTLFLRPCKVQPALLPPGRISSAVSSTLDSFEHAPGKHSLIHLFVVILTDSKSSPSTR